MRKNGETYTIDQNKMDAIAVYMDDEKREQIHNEFAPCSPEKFLEEYVKIDPDFEELLKDEFGLEF